MKLTTKRLCIDEATLSDADFFFSLLNSPSWLQYIGDRGIKTEKDAINYIQDNLMKSYVNNGFGLFKVMLKETKLPIGICGFLQRDYLEHPDIGFAILPKYEGYGYMVEACKAVMEYGTTKLDLATILAVTTEGNKKSRQLLSKLGFEVSGTVQPNGGDTVFLVFSN